MSTDLQNLEADYLALVAAIRDADQWLQACEGFNLLYHLTYEECEETVKILEPILKDNEL